MPERKGAERKTKKKNSLATIIIVASVILIAGVMIYFKYENAGSGVSAQLAQCIGAHSKVYIQLGCSNCATQESLFGDNWKYMNSTDCYYYPEACRVITENGYYRTPTWIINNQTYIGVQSIETLKSLTGC